MKEPLFENDLHLQMTGIFQYLYMDVLLDYTLCTPITALDILNTLSPI